jgi:hypothetical protein
MSRAHALATLDARVARAHDTAPALLNAHVHMLRVYLAIIAQHNPPYYLHAAHLPVRMHMYRTHMFVEIYASMQRLGQLLCTRRLYGS